jgi:hypothetical protein
MEGERLAAVRRILAWLEQGGDPQGRVSGKDAS